MASGLSVGDGGILLAPLHGHAKPSHIDPDNSALFVLVLEWLPKFLRIFEYPGVRCLVWHHAQARHSMLVEITLEGISRHWEAVDQACAAHQLATSLALSEVNPTTLCCRAATDLPLLLPCKDQVEPLLLDDKGSLRGAPHATALTGALLLPASRGVALVTNDAVTATVTNDAVTATMYLPFPTCRRCIFLEASSAELCPRRSGSVLATRHATFLNSFGLRCSFRHVASPGRLMRGRSLSPNGYGISRSNNNRTVY